MEKVERVSDTKPDAMSAGCNDEENDNLPAWASGLRRRAHLCKWRWSMIFSHPVFPFGTKLRSVSEHWQNLI